MGSSTSNWNIALLLSLGLAVCVLKPGAADAQAAGVRRAVVSEARPAGRWYVGVLGEVAQPGVYEQSGPDVTLHDVLEQASGLTTAASRQVRIVRGGRVGPQVYYSPDVPCSLAPGDLVVVDAGQSGPPWSATPAAERRSEVQLALVQLIERPVVLKVRREHATVRSLVALLGQPPEMERLVRVIPAAGQRSFDPEQVPTANLASGSVLVFPSAVVRRETIPVLDRPRSPAASPSRPGIGVVEVVTAAEPPRTFPAHAEFPTPAGQTRSDDTGPRLLVPPPGGAAFEAGGMTLDSIAEGKPAVDVPSAAVDASDARVPNRSPSIVNPPAGELSAAGDWFRGALVFALAGCVVLVAAVWGLRLVAALRQTGQDLRPADARSEVAPPAGRVRPSIETLADLAGAAEEPARRPAGRRPAGLMERALLSVHEARSSANGPGAGSRAQAFQGGRHV